MDTGKRSAYDEAVRFLSRRYRTASETRDHLTGKGYPADETSYVVSELISGGYLDDYRYAAAYLERGFDKKRGAARIKRELALRGVASDVIDNACEDYMFEHGISELDNAIAVARRAAEDMEVFGAREQGRIARKLSGLGYSSRDIYRVIETLRQEIGKGEGDEDICDW